MALTCSTFIPSRTCSMQARAPGAPSTETMQLGHWPAQHISPRGRWYLKLREKIRRPEAYSAEPIVSPSYASTCLPSNVNWTSFCAGSARRAVCGAGSCRVRGGGLGRLASAGRAVISTSLVRVSRSAMNHALHPER